MSLHVIISMAKATSLWSCRGDLLDAKDNTSLVLVAAWLHDAKEGTLPLQAPVV